jgi:hypothetical protein
MRRGEAMDQQYRLRVGRRLLVDEGKVEPVMAEELHRAGNSLEYRDH